MNRHGLLTGFVVAALASTAAVAQNNGSEAEQEACTPDVMRLCQDYIPNEGPIVSCLKLNRARLSPACHQVFFPVVDSPVTPHKRKRHRRHAS